MNPVKYICYVGKAHKNAASYKGAIYPEELKPTKGEVTRYEFMARTDKQAISELMRLHEPNDKRPLSCHSYIGLCREKIKPGTKNRVPYCIDLSRVAEPLKSKIVEALSLVEPSLNREGDRYAVPSQFHVQKPKETLSSRKDVVEGEPNEVDILPDEPLPEDNTKIVDDAIAG